MLDKEICVFCWQRSQVDFGVPERERWSSRFDMGDCGCPFWVEKEGFRHFSSTDVLDLPPSWCPYATEHIVKTQECRNLVP